MEPPDVAPATEQSEQPWRCEVAWHSHTTTARGNTCHPDTARHPELETTS